MRPNHVRHEDDHWIDHAEIVTVPRWKESELSGDEWRFSYQVRLYRKKILVGEKSFGSMVYAAGWLTMQLQVACPAEQEWPPDAPGQPYGDGYFCDNPSCSDRATWRGLLKQRFCRDGQAHEQLGSGSYRAFCDRHKTRGDCALEDADRNYEWELIEQEVTA